MQGSPELDRRSHSLQACPTSSRSEPTSALTCRVALFPEPSHQSHKTVPTQHPVQSLHILSTGELTHRVPVTSSKREVRAGCSRPEIK